MILSWTSYFQEWRGSGDWVHWYNQWFNQICHWNEIPVKTPDTRAQVYSPCWKSYTDALRRWHVLRTRKQHQEPSQALYYAFLIVCSWFASIVIKLWSQGVVLSWARWVNLENSQTWGNSGNPQILRWSKLKITWESLNLWLVSEVKAVLWRTMPLTCEISHNS